MGKYIVAFFGMLLSMEVYSGAEWSTRSPITGVFQVSSDKMLVRFANYNNPTNCSVNGGHLQDAGHVIFNPSEEKETLSLVLTAFASGVDVAVFVIDGCTPVWAESSYGNFNHIRLYK